MRLQLWHRILKETLVLVSSKNFDPEWDNDDK